MHGRDYNPITEIKFGVEQRSEKIGDCFQITIEKDT